MNYYVETCNYGQVLVAENYDDAFEMFINACLEQTDISIDLGVMILGSTDGFDFDIRNDKDARDRQVLCLTSGVIQRMIKAQLSKSNDIVKFNTLMDIYTTLKNSENKVLGTP